MENFVNTPAAVDTTAADAAATLKNGIYLNGKKYESWVDGTLIATSYNMRTAEIAIEKHLGTYVHGRSKAAKRSESVVQVVENESKVSLVGSIKPVAATQSFHVNDRFDFLEKAITMVADGVQPSVVVTGKGGVGKSFTVRKALEEKSLDDISNLLAEDTGENTKEGCFVFIKGFSTAKNLYRSLYNNNGGVVVLDDIDSVLKDANAVNILKAVLDSYDTRIVSWGAEMRGDDDLPRSFEFTGSVIIITNLNCEEIDQAILSRSLVIDLKMTSQEIVDRMRVIANSASFLPEYSEEIKMDSIEFIEEHKHIAKDLSLRTLISVSKIRSEFPDDWHNMAKYIMCK